MFVVIPTGKTYTATVKSEYKRRCVCEKCGTEFTYTFMVSGSGKGSSPLFVRNKAAADDAQKNAAANMEKAAQSAFPPVACPKCNHIQDQMLQYYRRTRFPRLHLFLCTALFLIVLISVITMFAVGSFQMLRSPVYWAFVLTPAGLIGGIRLLRRYSNPKIPSQGAPASAPAQ